MTERYYYNDKGYRPHKGLKGNSAKPISNYLLTILTGKLCCELSSYIISDKLYYGYNTKASTNNPDSINIYVLGQRAKEFIMSEGYEYSINSHRFEVTIKKGDYSYTLYHKTELKAVIAMAETVLRNKYPFMPRRHNS